ncbi:discoidin domain-containing protein [Phocaeicola barnesiae]|uniref:discoidin domain-containing protein n=1 Tax=Phocaeicola barnesiae TaxID=376804 RepID=UPI001F2B6646|nr:discoidin domain-containing protein [Phocaeicola barnesiae]
MWALALTLPVCLAAPAAGATVPFSPIQAAVGQQQPLVSGATLLNPTTVEVLFSNQQRMMLDFYGENMVRFFQDNAGGIVRDPEAVPPAQILVDRPRLNPGTLQLEDEQGKITVRTPLIAVEIDKQSGLFCIRDLASGKAVVEETAPVQFTGQQVTLTLKENPDEYFYGGGVQNGRFSHKGQAIEIVNTNQWTDGGVASPTPFYWSTRGYGMMGYTFAPGKYDFGASRPGTVLLTHDTSYLDCFFWLDDTPVSLLNSFYQLTGHPVLLPKFGFYEGHLNAYNRDYWKEDAENGKKSIKLKAVTSAEAYEQGTDVYYYEESPELNRFATSGSEFASVQIRKNPVVHVKLHAVDVTADRVQVEMKGFAFAPADNLLKQTGALQAPQARITDENAGAYTLTPTWEPVPGADYYEIESEGMIYSTIRQNSLTFEDLKVETDYAFRIRSVNASGASEWSSFSGKTKSDPLEFAIRGIKGETSCPNQPGQPVRRLFNFDETDAWHTEWSKAAVPFDLIIDLKSINTLDRFDYLPRLDGGNGTLQKGEVFYSMDRTNWTSAGTFDWQGGDVKHFTFTTQPVARYIKIAVSQAVGNFGSGRELYVFRVPGTDTFIPGDINNDKKIDHNDLTSYMNYTGLRKGDSDYEGYISKGDLNENGLIDAYDISAVGIELESGVSSRQIPPVAGSLVITPQKKTYRAGETVTLEVSGKGLRSVNAFSFALPYNPEELEYLGIDTPGIEAMKNMTNDRLHTNGVKALYPTFVNIGEQPYLEGDNQLLLIRFKAKKDYTYNLQPIDGMLVDKMMNAVTF